MADRDQDSRDNSSRFGPFERVPDTLDRVGVTAGDVLIMDPDRAAGEDSASIIRGDGHRVTVVTSAAQALDLARGGQVDVVVVDPVMDGMPPDLRVVDAFRALSPLPPEVVVATAHNDVDTAVVTLHRGAADYLVKPLNPHRLRLAIARALEARLLKVENRQLRRDLTLVESAHRLMETLDPVRLAPLALELLCDATGAEAGALLEQGAPVTHHGLQAGELTAVTNLRLPANSVRVPPRRLHGPLGRFADALMLDLGEQRQAVVLNAERFSPAQEEDARFLCRHVNTAFKNVARFASAERRACRDPLTGMLNATAFMDQLALTVSAHPARPVSVLFLDLDHFKQVNDVHGHLMGSAVLVEVSRILQSAVRLLDSVCRYGGDEFAVLLDGAPVEVAHSIAERIRRSVEEHRFLAREGLKVRLSTCVGVATFPFHGRSAMDIVDQADRAMYRGKAASRNAVHVAGSLT